MHISNISSRLPFRTRLFAMALTMATWLTGCGDGTPLVGDPSPPHPQNVSRHDSGTAPTPTRRIPVYEDNQIRLEYDSNLRDPIWAAGRCGDLIAACLRQTPELDNCVRDVQVCASPRPWEETTPCCPQECLARYRGARDRGMAPIEAYGASYTEPGSACYPGVAEALRTDSRRAPQ